MVLVCHVTSQYHEVKGSDSFTCRSHLAEIVDHRQSSSGGIMVLPCHVISQENVTEWSRAGQDKTPSCLVL